MEEYLQGLLVAMAEPGDGRHLDITRESAQSAYTCDSAGYLRYPAQPGRDLKAIAGRLGWRLSQRHSGNLAYHRLTPPRVTAIDTFRGDVSGRFESHRHIRQRVHGLFSGMCLVFQLFQPDIYTRLVTLTLIYLLHRGGAYQPPKERFRKIATILPG